LEDVSRSKQELEDRHLKLAREKAELSSQLQENEEELQVSSCLPTIGPKKIPPSYTRKTISLGPPRANIYSSCNTIT
jgi:hypothetical protein